MGSLCKDRNAEIYFFCKDTSTTEALMVVGIMMSFATNSRPASGSEHHLSHFFEITGIVKNQPYFAHGIDVFYSTYVTAQIREKLSTVPYSAQYISYFQNLS